jgi:hypothetical protein
MSLLLLFLLLELLERVAVERKAILVCARSIELTFFASAKVPQRRERSTKSLDLRGIKGWIVFVYCNGIIEFFRISESLLPEEIKICH